AFDAFGHQLVGGAPAFEVELVLEVAVAAATSHRADRSHAAIFLVAAPLEENQLAGALVGAGEEIPDHRAARAHGNRLDDVARVADAAVGDHGHVANRRRLRALHHRA